MLKRTLQVFGVAFLFGLLLTVAAHAGVNLKNVQVTGGQQVDLIFDQKIAANQVKIEYLRDIIQISLTNVSVYPARVSTVSGSELSKVFAYQYSPDLVRCRLTVKGDSAQYQERVQMKISGKTVTLRIASAKADQVATTAAAAARSEEESKPQLNSDEKQLLDRVMKNVEPAKAEAKEAKAEKSERAEKKSKKEKLEKTNSLADGKSLPTPMKSIGIMLFTIGLLAGFLMFMKKVKGQKLFKSEAKGLSKFLGRLTGGASRGMIEVIATHHLAPKKSIVMVKIQDRMLVLGMTNDSVNLITEFKANEEVSEGEEPVNVKAFAEGLKKFERDEGPSRDDQKQATQASFAGILTKAFGQVARNERPEPKLSQPANSRMTPSTPNTTATRSAGAVNAYASGGRAAYGAGAQSVGEPSFAESPSLAAALKGSGAKTSIRAQVRNKVEGLKNL